MDVLIASFAATLFSIYDKVTPSTRAAKFISRANVVSNIGFDGYVLMCKRNG